jgi:hypothetical protein
MIMTQSIGPGIPSPSICHPFHDLSHSRLQFASPAIKPLPLTPDTWLEATFGQNPQQAGGPGIRGAPCFILRHRIELPTVPGPPGAVLFCAPSFIRPCSASD